MLHTIKYTNRGQAAVRTAVVNADNEAEAAEVFRSNKYAKANGSNIVNVIPNEHTSDVLFID